MVFFEEGDEFIGWNNGSSTWNGLHVFDEGPVYDMSPQFDWSLLEKLTRKISTLKSFLKHCLDLFKDKNESQWFYSISEEPKEDPRQEKIVNHIHRRMNTGRKLCMKHQIGDYDMDFIKLNLVLDFKILTKKTWESMGKTK